MGNTGRIKLTIPDDVKEKISDHAKMGGVSLRYLMESVIGIYLDDLESNPRSLIKEALSMITLSDETVMLDVDISSDVKSRIAEYCKDNDEKEKILILCSIKHFIFKKI